MIIYQIKNTINNKVYIGQTQRTIEKRYPYGRWWNNNTNKPLLRALKKYGANNFKILILERCDSLDSLNEREIYWIKYYKKLNLCYNLSDGGKGPLGFIASQETKEKQRIAHLGDKNPMFGIKVIKTEEVRNRLSQSRIRNNYEIITPEGNYLFVTSLNKFAKNNNLNPSHLYEVARGERNHCKNYKISKTIKLK